MGQLLVFPRAKFNREIARAARRSQAWPVVLVGSYSGVRADRRNDGVDCVGERVGAFNVNIVAAGQDALRAVGAEFDEFFLQREAFFFEDVGWYIKIVAVATDFACENEQWASPQRPFLRG